MALTWLEGKAVAEAVRAELQTAIAALPYTPELAFVRVGEDPASVAYVRGKEKMAQALGIRTHLQLLPADSSQAQLMACVAELNAQPDIDGVLVQLPLPAHLQAEPVLEAIDPAKDVDGFHPVNVGRLWTGQEALVPCTPEGLVRIMDHYQLPIAGQHCVIVGRSNLVGKPAAALFLQRHATVSLAHSRSQDVAALTRQADILIAAVGKAAFITADMVKPGAVVLDVGISRIDDKLVGDVAPEVTDVAAYLTPMPGGTGRVTVAMLMQNTYRAATRRRSESHVQ